MLSYKNNSKLKLKRLINPKVFFLLASLMLKSEKQKKNTIRWGGNRKRS